MQKSIFRLISALFFTTLIFVACSKDKYSTKPQLSVKEVKNYNVGRGDLIDITLEFTDKEGDITDSIFIRTLTTRCATSNRTVGYPIPKFTTSANIKGEFKIIYENLTTNTGYPTYTGNFCGRPDTTTFFFWAKDKAKNISDTIKIDKPIIIRSN